MLPPMSQSSAGLLLATPQLVAYGVLCHIQLPLPPSDQLSLPSRTVHEDDLGPDASNHVAGRGQGLARSQTHHLGLHPTSHLPGLLAPASRTELLGPAAQLSGCGMGAMLRLQFVTSRTLGRQE